MASAGLSFSSTVELLLESNTLVIEFCLERTLVCYGSILLYAEETISGFIFCLTIYLGNTSFSFKSLFRIRLGVLSVC